jgi:hypothetical protein
MNEVRALTRLLVAATQVSFLRSKASLLIHRWPLQFSEGSAALGRDKADLVQHVRVEDCCTSLSKGAKEEGSPPSVQFGRAL